MGTLIITPPTGLILILEHLLNVFKIVLITQNASTLLSNFERNQIIRCQALVVYTETIFLKF
jgi:hypothetical protein